jgi:hypothetical protein
MLGVPVVHASHAGRFEGLAWPGEAVAYSSKSGHEYYLSTTLPYLEERFRGGG